MTASTRHAGFAQRLQDALALKLPPVAVCFSDEAPANTPAFEGAVPAGCAFWEQAAQRAFSTRTTDHELCAIGVHTHNLSAPSGTYASELVKVLKVMNGMDYVREAEVDALPRLQTSPRHVTYGPLAEAPLTPDAVLLFAHSQQSLVITEAVQRVDGGHTPAMGRPACAVIPQVVNTGRAALSLGCCGARAYVDALSDEVALWALPGKNIAAYAEQIAVLAHANQTLTRFHERRRDDVTAGRQPTVQESLDRMNDSPE